MKQDFKDASKVFSFRFEVWDLFFYHIMVHEQRLLCGDSSSSIFFSAMDEKITKTNLNDIRSFVLFIFQEVLSIHYTNKMYRR